ncbi:MAG: hypothetical protein NTX64_11425, partial [Elusimicrobia bacterium]|nr:hypothetical protein [Elusimicrobiota bacterium]
AEPRVAAPEPRVAAAEAEHACLDWEPMVRAIIDDLGAGAEAGTVSARFHNTLAEAVVAVAKRQRPSKVLLTGGCFQNAALTERTVARLREEGFTPYWHQRVPPNDGGIALGQLAAAAYLKEGACASPSPAASKR